jgi:hypothetical protein
LHHSIKSLPGTLAHLLPSAAATFYCLPPLSRLCSEGHRVASAGRPPSPTSTLVAKLPLPAAKHCSMRRRPPQEPCLRYVLSRASTSPHP